MKNQFINIKPVKQPNMEPQEVSTDTRVETQNESRPDEPFKAPLPSTPSAFPTANQALSSASQFKDSRPNSLTPDSTPSGYSDPPQHFAANLNYPYGQASSNASAPFSQAWTNQQAIPGDFAPPPPGFAPNFFQPSSFAPASAPPEKAQTWYEQVPTSHPEQRPPAWSQTPPTTQPRAASWQNMPNWPQPSGGPSMPQAGAAYMQRQTPPALPISIKPKKRGLPIWSRVLLTTLAVLMVLIGAGYAYYQVNYGSSISNITNQQVIHHNSKGDVVTPAPTADVLTGNRLNILLLGSDTDGKSLPLAQTDIIITIDPQTKYVGMLSIPRDLRLYAPKAGAIKLDEAFATGWALPGNNNYGNAVGLSIDTIEQNFGIPINYSAWVGLDGFVKVIDTAGGIDVDVLHPMVDDIYPNDVNNQNATDYERLYIAPGPQHLDGIHALEYVRTRHSDGQADFGRSVRQQQILSQLKNKLTQIDVTKLPQLIQDLNGHVKTDMQISDIPKLINFARGIDPNKIDKLVLSAPYSVPASTVYPKDTSTDYLPVCSQIIPKIQQMFDLGDKATCPTVGARYSFPTTASATTTTQSMAVAQSSSKTAMTTTDAWQMIGASTPVNALSLSATGKDPSDVRSLLNLMFLTVFESFNALQT
jgi:LCP family protein required for cell wall assembly